MPAFTSAMEEIKSVSVEAYNWLEQRPTIHWSRSHFHTWCKCDMLLNNLCESFNATILSARSQPIVTTLEQIRHLLMESVVKKREAMKRVKGPLCPKIQRMLEKTKEYAAQWIPKWNGHELFEVLDPFSKQSRVDLNCRVVGARDGFDWHPNEIFSLVVRYKIIKIMLSIVAFYELELEQIDVVTTFLNSDLDETIFMIQPEVYVDKLHEDCVKIE
ncbi:hypothetical protein Dimus_039145 [Dionaea muscipula]